MLFAATSSWTAGSLMSLFAAQQPLGATLSNPVKVLLAAAIVVASIALGKAISRAVRLPDHDWKIGVIAFTTLVSLAIAILYWPPKLGIDLSGGAILVYEVDQGKEKPNMDDLTAAISKRVNPGGQKEITIRPYGDGQVEIVVPEVDQGELTRLKDLISSIGSLEFRIIADKGTGDLPLIERAQKLPPNKQDVEGSVPDPRTGTPTTTVLARWVPVGEDAMDLLRFENLARRQLPPLKPDEPERFEMLMLMDKYNVKGEDLANTRPGSDEVGKRCIEFQLKPDGARRFQGLTGDNIPSAAGLERHLAIILDGILDSAPTIRSAISSNGQITGEFSEEEIKKRVGVLNAGKLPASLNPKPISELITGPTLGADTIRSGSISILVSVSIVVLFMIWYYRFAGLVAAVAVLLNVLMTIAVAIVIKAPFTLPGLAGLALTLGMAVDANVLIYERMREELRGAALRMAIRNGFSRAMTTIIDSNLTTLITATVLYWIGTDQIKGFAVMLWLGLIISMFTACFCSRVAFDIWEKMKWITRLDMRQILGVTHFNFVAGMRTCMVISALAVAIGLVALYDRGTGILGIDFTGGSLVEFIFQKPTNIGDVRTRLEQIADLPDVTVTDISQGNEDPQLRFRMETSNVELDNVKAELTKAFAGQLSPNTLVSKEIAMIPLVAPGVDGADTSNADPAKEPGASDESQKPSGDSSPANPPASGDAGDATKEKESEEKPNEGEETKESAKPADGQPPEGASRSTAADRQVASLGGASDVLLALTAFGQEAESPKNQPEPAAEPPAADKPADEKPAEEQPAADDQTTPQEPADAADSPAASDEPESPPKQETPNLGDQPATTEPPAATGVETFAGKTVMQLKLKEPVTRTTMRELIATALRSPAFQEIDPTSVAFTVTNPDYREGSNASYHDWEVRVALPLEQGKLLADAVEEQVLSAPYFPSSSNIGSRVAKSASHNAWFALISSSLFIALYLWVRFQRVAYGVAAVVALVHDVMVALAALAVSYYVAPYLGIILVDQFKIDLSVIAALLTIIGFSVNDTVVIFDRIREVKGKSPHLTPQIINDSVNQTLSRTILTSLTVFLVTVILYIWGGKSIHGFAFTFLIGVITGTYSSIYVAAPLLLWLTGDAGKTTTTGRGAASTSESLSKSA